MKKNLLFVAAIAIVPVILIGLRKNSAPFFSVEEYQCVQDAVLSNDYFSAINTALAGLFKERCGAHLIIDRLKQQFPVLRKVVIAYRPSGTRVMISAYEPICSINNSHVLTQNNELFDKNIFAVEELVGIPEIMCHLSLSVPSSARPEPVEGYLGALEENPSTRRRQGFGGQAVFTAEPDEASGRAPRNDTQNIPQLISSLLQTLPSDMYQTYDLELIHEHCMRFIDKEKPQFTIVSSVAQEKLAQLLVQCATIKQTIDEKKGFDKGATWVADTRFAHYIVAYKA